MAYFNCRDWVGPIFVPQSDNMLDSRPALAATGGGDDVQQWARVSFAVGIRTVPAGSLQFVDFSRPLPFPVSVLNEWVIRLASRAIFVEDIIENVNEWNRQTAP